MRSDSTTSRLEVLPQPRHPSLHFDAAGRERLREAAASTHRRYVTLLLEWVDRNAAWSPPLHLPDNALNEVHFEECGAFVTNAALAFVVCDTPPISKPVSAAE